MEYTIRDLLGIVDFSDVERIVKCVYYYKDDEKMNVDAYRNVFEKLKTYDKVVPDVGDRISIKASPLVDDEKRWYNVSLIKEDGVDYAIDFTDWKELVDIPISVPTIEHYTSEDIVAHFLWEITFFGYSVEDMVIKRKEIMSRTDEERGVFRIH